MVGIMLLRNVPCEAHPEPDIQQYEERVAESLSTRNSEQNSDEDKNFQLAVDLSLEVVAWAMMASKDRRWANYIDKPQYR